MMTQREKLTPYYPVLAVILWLMSFTVTFAPMPDPLRWVYILFFPVLLGMEVFRRWRMGNLTFPGNINVFEAAIAAYFVLVFASLFLTDSLPLPRDVYSVEFLFQIATPVFLYWFVRIHPLDHAQLRLLAFTMVGVILVETVLGYISFRYPAGLPEAIQPRVAHIYKRGTGTFVSPEGFVTTLLFGMVVVFYISLRAHSERERWLLRGTLVVAIIGAIISQNRTGWFNLILLTGVICFLDRALIKWIAGGVLALLIAVLLFYPGFIDKTRARLGEWRQVESRIIMNDAGLRMAAEKPLLGWGFATYDLYDWQFMQPVGSMEPTRFEFARATSHNTYLTILAETGVIGLALYLLTTVYWLWNTFRAWRAQQQVYDWNLLILMWTMIVMVHIAAQLADMRFFPFILGYWWLALAIIANELTKRISQQRDSPLQAKAQPVP